jgi:MFS family permease
MNSASGPGLHRLTHGLAGKEFMTQDFKDGGAGESQPNPNQPKVYRCGTLTYTGPALAMLFFWLLWGDFIYMLMEAVTPSIMPLKFDSLGASSTMIGIVVVSIPACIYSVLNPILSFKSDRHRGPRGRRIPFILLSLPFLVACLILLGFGDKIGHWLHGHALPVVAHHFGHTAATAWWQPQYWLARLSQMSPNAVILATMGVMLAVFTVFNTFVTSVFWYLFNDVVPEYLLARFMSWFRMVSLMAGSLYNWFVYKHALTHTTAILVGAAVLYFVGFGLMCLNVKEGQYPPAPPKGKGAGPFAAIGTYAKECFAIKHWWYQWAGTFLGSVGAGVGMFGVFGAQAIGLDLGRIGKIGACSGWVTAGLILVSGWLADKYHPFRVVLVGAVLSFFVATPLGLIWLFWHPTSMVAFEVSMALSLAVAAPIGALNGVYDPPLFMRLFPRDRYGQYCSANAMCRAAGGIVGGVLGGVYFDVMRHFHIMQHFPGNTPIYDKYGVYLLGFLYSMSFGVPCLFLTFGLFRSWKRYGGDESYVPPVPGVESPDETLMTTAGAMANEEVAAVGAAGERE